MNFNKMIVFFTKLFILVLILLPVYLFDSLSTVKASVNCVTQYVVPCKTIDKANWTCEETPESSWVDKNNVYLPEDIDGLKYYFILNSNWSNTDLSNTWFSVFADGGIKRNKEYYGNPVHGQNVINIENTSLKLITGVIDLDTYNNNFTKNSPHKIKVVQLQNSDKPDIENVINQPPFCGIINYNVAPASTYAPIQQTSCSGECFTPGVKCPVCPASHVQNSCNSDAGLANTTICKLHSSGAQWEPSNPECRLECVDNSMMKGTSGPCQWKFYDKNDNVIRPPFSIDLFSSQSKIDVNIPGSSTDSDKYSAKIETQPVNSFVFSNNDKWRIDTTFFLGLNQDLAKKISIYRKMADNTISEKCTQILSWKDVEDNSDANLSCDLTITPSNIDSSTEILLSVETKQNKFLISKAEINISDSKNYNQSFDYIAPKFNYNDPNSAIYNFEKSLSLGYPVGNYTAQTKIYFYNTSKIVTCSKQFSVNLPNVCKSYDSNDPIQVCTPGDCTGTCYYCPGCDGYKAPNLAPYPDLTSICDKLTGDNQSSCLTCMQDKNQKEKGSYIWTAIGCVPTDVSLFLSLYVFTYGIGIAGGIAFLFFIYGCFLILTSAGNAERVEQAKQIITSALSGLILIIFSVLLLKIIGVDVLRIPGFSG